MCLSYSTRVLSYDTVSQNLQHVCKHLAKTVIHLKSPVSLCSECCRHTNPAKEFIIKTFLKMFEIHRKDHVFGLLGSPATKKAGNCPILTKNLLKISSGFRLTTSRTVVSCLASVSPSLYDTIPSTLIFFASIYERKRLYRTHFLRYFITTLKLLYRTFLY